MKTKEETDPPRQLTETLFELSHMYGSHTQKKLTGESLLYCEQLLDFRSNYWKESEPENPLWQVI